MRLDAQRAEQAATAARLQHQQRVARGTDDSADGSAGAAADGSPDGSGGGTGCGGPVVVRLLTVPTQWDHVRSILAYVAGRTPLPGPEARLLVLMLVLRTARTGTGNLVGQDVAGLGLSDPQHLIGQLADCGWLDLPGTADDLLASRPENATLITIPSLLPDGDGDPGPFTFGRKLRPKLSGWAQKIVADKKLRKTKATAAGRLLALTLATQTNAEGRLGPGGQGLALDSLATWYPLAPGELQPAVEQLTAADWLTEATLTDSRLTGRLTERVLPLTCPLP